MHFLRELLGRPVAWGAVILTYIGLIGVGVYTFEVNRIEGQVRERDLCGVVINVHRNNRDQMRTSQNAYQQTREYLRVRRGDELSALELRIKQNLPVARRRMIDSVESYVATTPPPTCAKYEQKEPYDPGR